MFFGQGIVTTRSTQESKKTIRERQREQERKGRGSVEGAGNQSKCNVKSKLKKNRFKAVWKKFG